MHASFGVKQLRSDTHSLATLPNRTIEHVADAQFAANSLHIDDLTLVSEGRASGDHKQPSDARKGVNDLFDHAVGKMLLFGILADIREWEHGDGRLLGQWRTRDGAFAGYASCGIARFVRRFSDVSNEAKAFPRQGSDQVLIPPIITDGSPRRIDARRQRCIRHDPAGPDCL